MSDENYNPWAVTCIDSFNFLCCPECVYRSREETSFQTHALQNHPKSKIFFKSVQSNLQNNAESSLFYCCPECDYKCKDVNTFQIHALEGHPSSLSFFTKDNLQDKESKLKKLR